MKKIGLLTITILALLPLLISACGTPAPKPTPTPWPTPTPIPPTPTAEVRESNYSKPAWGLALWYPEDWIYEEDEEQVLFASSEEVLKSPQAESGAGMIVLSSSLEEASLQEWFEDIASTFPFSQGGRTGDARSRTIAGQNGLIVTLEGTPEGSETPVKGFMAVAEQEGWGYLFLGVSVSDDWSEYSSVLEEMLDSVQFEAIQHVYTNSYLALTITYPEDWVYQENNDEVIFATSDEAIRDGNFETGAAMLVMGSSLGEASLQEWFQDVASEFPFEEGGPTDDARPHIIAGQGGVLVTFEGIPEGNDTPVTGFMAATEYEGWGYFFLALSALDQWTEHGPVLQEMLASVQFTE